MPSAAPRRHGGSAGSAVSSATDLKFGRLAARSRDTSRAPAAHSTGGARGSEASLRGLFKDQLVERQVGDGPLEPRILLLQPLQTACLGNLQPALSRKKMKAWLASDLSELDLLVIQIDGLHVGGHVS